MMTSRPNGRSGVRNETTGADGHGSRFSRTAIGTPFNGQTTIDSITILDRQEAEICTLQDGTELDDVSRKILHGEVSRRYLSAVVQR